MADAKFYLTIAIASFLVFGAFLVPITPAVTGSIPTTVSTTSATTSASSSSSTTVGGGNTYPCGTNFCTPVQKGYSCPAGCTYSYGCTAGKGGIGVYCSPTAKTSSSTITTTTTVSTTISGGYCGASPLSIEDSAQGCGPASEPTQVTITINIAGTAGDTARLEGYFSSTTLNSCPTGASSYSPLAGYTTTLSSSGTGSFTLINLNGKSGSTACFMVKDISSGALSNPVQYNFGASSSGPGGSISAKGIVAQVCSIYFAASTVIFILALTLMILGGAIYAGAQLIPAQTRGTVQGYAMGMVMGGIIGLVIAVLAPYILGLVTGNSLLFSTACI